MTPKPETLCTGCGATVTMQHGFLSDAGGSNICPNGTPGNCLHWISELPPVAIKPEAALTPLEKELLAALAIAESTLASCYRIQFAQGVSKMADGDNNWVLKIIRAAISKAEAVQA